MNRFTIYLLLIALAGCTDKKTAEDYGPLFKKIMVTTDGTLRGNSIGEPMAEVKERETAPLSDESDHYLYYSGTIDQHSDFIVSYYFGDEGLYEANLDVFSGNPETADETYRLLGEFFSEQYGEPQQDGPIRIWRSESGGDEIEIALNLEIQEDGASYVTVSLLKAEMLSEGIKTSPLSREL